MAKHEKARYSIAEAAAMLEVEPHVLRQWEDRIPQLKPARNRAGHRYYTDTDIAVAKRIKYLIRHEGMSTEAVRRQLSEELPWPGVPKTREDMVHLVDRIQEEVRAMLDLLDSDGQ
ncbi:MAG TPA: MerR family transcriptional regulator [Candidatus Hydrogenedentes bacterium]|nr:MerR family transcriptional regulator [Candidatus Hydrogenedentota bacterium]HPG70081.1 MerR family transcriptional regulator [Candidatus Hydrogenedentota bacterium]